MREGGRKVKHKKGRKEETSRPRKKGGKDRYKYTKKDRRHN